MSREKSNTRTGLWTLLDGWSHKLDFIIVGFIIVGSEYITMTLGITRTILATYTIEYLSFISQYGLSKNFRK